ncbi:hypothetical protein FJU08_17445 [Martelella alba]|uniref:Uncharacterized protein n=1 Tax=Martelella alba TaxID=2590451 RepID=A0A506U550_9HYPH|nr:hypothetical protein [Martelella alba]TPW28588.1 hypothetical protein FJU08_17445 [Martelella alba]
MRAIFDENDKKLKAATRRAIKAAGGSDSFAHVTRVSVAQLSKYGLASEDHTETFVPIDIALEADLEAGAPIIASELARLQGFRLVRAADEDAGHKLAFRDISSIGLTFSNFQKAMHDALADDGSVDDAERQVIQRHGDKMARALIELLGRV